MKAGNVTAVAAGSRAMGKAEIGVVSLLANLILKLNTRATAG